MDWFKSSYSGANDQCVECRFAPGEVVHVRDTKHREVPPLVFTADEWRSFVADVKSGVFDAP